ncbi:MAG: hypothetical protein QXT39_06795 [Conexivisphaerales archaeon]
MKLIPFRLARFYHDLSYLFLFSILIFAIASPVFATPKAAGSVTLTLVNTSYGVTQAPRQEIPSTYYVKGIVIISGDYVYYSSTPFNTSTSQNLNVRAGNSTGSAGGTLTINGTTYYTEPAPMNLSGTATVYYMGKVNGHSQMENITEPISFNNPYYTGQSAAFTTYFNTLPPTSSPEYFLIYIQAESNNQLLAETSTTIAPSGAVNLFTTIVALPVFNDSMLGANITGVNSGQPSLPLGGLFNLMLIISLIVLTFSVLFIFFTPQRGERLSFGSALAKVAIGIIIMLLFPLIYDHIAELINLLNQTIIAYPAPAPAYNIVLQNIYNSILLPTGGNFLSILEAGVLFIANAVVAIIVWIMLYLVGTVRIFLIAGMIIMFPLSIALRDIPFTQKLGRIIEDTFFGLILATILSASMLSAAGYLLLNWNTSTNIFIQAGIPSEWMASAAIIVAILAPTVLAPLTSTVYQTTSQVAMAAGSVALAVFSGFGAGSIEAAGPLGGVAGGAGGAGGAGNVAAANIPRRSVGRFFAYGALGALEAGLESFGEAIRMRHGPAHVARKIGRIRV